jgi:hypothetical protein
MKIRQKAKSIVISWDFALAFLSIFLMILVVPSAIPAQVAKEIYATSLATLAIIFSVFFAALTVLITSGDNEFVKFLEEDGSFSQIVWSFKFTLLVLFVALVLSIGLFIFVLAKEAQGTIELHPGAITVAFAGFSFYALFSTLNSSLDAIKYAEFRVKFLKVIRPK